MKVNPQDKDYKGTFPPEFYEYEAVEYANPWLALILSIGLFVIMVWVG
jgi:hypothetical protein